MQPRARVPASPGSAVAAGIEGTGRKLDTATQTGSGEAGTVSAAGIEGTGRKLDAATRTGAGEPGSVVAAGIEGTGYRVAAGITVGAGEHGSVVAAGIEGTGQARGGQYQDIILLASDMDQDTATIKRWTLSTPIRVDDFLAPSGEERWLQRAMGRNDVGPDSFQLRLFFGESSAASIGGDDNDLLDSWELESQAVAFNARGKLNWIRPWTGEHRQRRARHNRALFLVSPHGSPRCA